METLGRHLLVELHGCDPSILDDVDGVRRILHEAAERANVKVLSDVRHRYLPQGVSVVLLVEESHFTIHTWPERGYAAVDLYSCGSGLLAAAVAVLRERCRADRVETLLVRRGLPDRQWSMRADEHRREPAGDVAATAAGEAD